MNDEINPLLALDQIITLKEIEVGLQDLINKEEEVNRITQRPLLQQHPSLLERIYHPTEGFFRDRH